jgi:hypothetical protein
MIFWDDYMMKTSCKQRKEVAMRSAPELNPDDGKRDKLFSVRMSSAELDALGKIAAARGLSTGDFARRMLLAQYYAELVESKLLPFNDALTDAAADGLLAPEDAEELWAAMALLSDALRAAEHAERAVAGMKTILTPAGRAVFDAINRLGLQPGGPERGRDDA